MSWNNYNQAGGLNMKIIKQFKIRTLLLGLVLIISSCGDDDSDCESINNASVELNMRLIYNTQFVDTISTSIAPRSHELHQKMDFFVAVYEQESNVLVKRHHFSYINKRKGIIDVAFRMRVPSKAIKIYAWADYDINREVYLIDEDGSIKFNNYHPRTGFPLNAYRSDVKLDLRNKSGQSVDVTAEMHIPFGAFKILASDFQKYQHQNGTIDSNDIIVNFTYPSWIPYRYNLIEDKASLFKTGVSFTSEANMWLNNQLNLGTDYLFIDSNGLDIASETSVIVDIKISRDSHVINQFKGVTIPLKRGSLTLVKGDFLTGEGSLGEGGIGIEYEFEDEIIIDF